MDLKEQLKSLSAQDRKELLKQLQQEEKESKRNRRDAYEGLRAQFMLEVKNRLLPVVDDVKAFRDWVEKEAAAFRAVMREYGQLRKDEQASFTIVDGDMKLEVRSNKVKSFDERADLAAERLVDYLKRYAMGRELGIDTADWDRVNAFCRDSRIAGKEFRELDCEALDTLQVKLRAIRRKRENKQQ